MSRKLITKQIEFEMTNHCNARCVFCPRRDTRPKGYIDLKVIKAGISLAKAAAIKGFKISGFGEPTLHPKLIEYLSWIRQEIPDAVIMLITNAALLKPELFEELARVPINRINISFNGYDKESYEAQMRGLDFEKVMGNLKYMAKANGNRINIQFVPILSKAFGKDEIEKMKHFLKRIGFEDENFKYHHTITWRAEKIKSEDLIDEEFIESLKDLPIEDKSKVVCLANLSTLYIGWQGDIHLCCNDIYGEALIGRIEELRTAEDLKKLEEKNVLLRANYSFDVCRKCDTPLTAHHEVKGDRIFTKFS
jgi:radical SAM protein with 4Fe4S-binding SPASM domain